MVCVRLDREWMDQRGASHAPGDLVDVDAGTLAELEAIGVVAAPAEPRTAEPRTKADARNGAAHRWTGGAAPDND